MANVLPARKSTPLCEILTARVRNRAIYIYTIITPHVAAPRQPHVMDRVVRNTRGARFCPLLSK